MADFNEALNEIASSLLILKGEMATLKNAGTPLSRGGNLILAVQTTSTDLTLTREDFFIRVDSSGGDVDISLPPTSEVYDEDIQAGQIYAIKKTVAGNVVNLYPDSEDTGGIEGNDPYVLNAADEIVWLQAGPLVWYRIL